MTATERLLETIAQHQQQQVIAARIGVKAVLTLEEAAVYVGLAYNTLAQTYMERGIAYSKVGTKPYFAKVDLDAYMMANRTASKGDIEDRADDYVNGRE